MYFKDLKNKTLKTLFLKLTFTNGLCLQIPDKNRKQSVHDQMYDHV